MTTDKRDVIEEGGETEASKKRKVSDEVNSAGEETEVTKEKKAEATFDAAQLATKFPSLKDSLQSKDSPIMALYFASAWCPDVQAVAPFVKAVVSSQTQDDKVVDLIYVSSDKDAAEMAGNVDDKWQTIPFENEEERSNLKRHFGACAQKELEGLNISSEDRKHGIPTLILVNKEDGKVLTTDAVDDISGDNKLDEPLKKWKSLLEYAIHNGTPIQ
jgi:thiol-disulfide isomerase/thioredoxin